MITTSRFQLPPFILPLLLASTLAFLSACDSTTGAASGKANEENPSLEELVTQLEKLPGLGSSGARQAAQHILDSSQEEAVQIADAIRAGKAAPRSSGTEKRPVPISVETAIEGDISSEGRRAVSSLAFSRCTTHER